MNAGDLVSEETAIPVDDLVVARMIAPNEACQFADQGQSPI